MGEGGGEKEKAERERWAHTRRFISVRRLSGIFVRAYPEADHGPPGGEVFGSAGDSIILIGATPRRQYDDWSNRRK